MSNELHITVVSGFGDSGSTLDVAHETALVKSALLYADRVTLASPRVAMLAMLAPILTATEEERATIVQELAARLPGGADVAAQVDAFRRKKRLTVDERYRLQSLNKAMRDAGADLAATADELLTNAGVPELAVAMQAGVLSIDALGLDQGADAQGVMERIVQ